MLCRETFDLECPISYHYQASEPENILKKIILQTFLQHCLWIAYVYDRFTFYYYLKDIVDLLFRKIDLDRDGVISFDEYRNFVLSKPESLELFGSCLPSRTSIFAFLATVRSNIRKL